MPTPILKHQAAFLQSTSTHTGLVGGFGSGKSRAATIKVIEKKKQYPGVDVAYYLPNYSLIKGIAFPNIRNVLTDMEMPFHLHNTDKEFITPLGKIIMRSMSNPETIVGYEVGYSVIDEADTLKKENMSHAFNQIIARNRIKLYDGSVNSTDLVSTPEGFEFMYDFFVKNKKDNRNLIKAKSTDNPYLPDSFFETLKETYTAEQLDAYINGEFVNLNSKTVYYTFNREIHHTNRLATQYETLYVGMDFNITNMNAVIHVLDGSTLYAVDEVAEAFDTSHMIQALREKYPNNRIVIYPDASGASRSTSGKTDFDLLKAARFTNKAGKSNPAVRDRVTSLNTRLKNANGNINYYINTDTCPIYTEALEKQSYKNGVPDKSGGYDHITEAAGYCVHGLSSKKSFRMYA